MGAKTLRKMCFAQTGELGQVGHPQLIGKGMSMTKNSGIEFLVRTPKEEKLGEIRILYPDSYAQESLKEDFTKLIKQTKKGARKSSVIATALTPFALAFDVSCWTSLRGGD